MADDERPGEKAGERPRQVTMGVLVAGGCSAAMVAVVVSVMGRLRTVEFRESLTAFLAQQRESGLAVSLEQATTVVRVGLMVTGAVAAAMLVFAFFAARRDKSARIAMSVLALPMLVCGIFVDPFLAGFIVASTVLLWTGPAADWFAGRAPRPLPDGPRDGRTVDMSRKPDLSAFTGGTPPPNRPMDAPAPPPVDLDTLPPPAAPDPSGPPAWSGSYGNAVPAAHAAHAAPGTRRPPRLVAAVILASVPSLLVAGLMAMTALVVQTSAGEEELRRVLRDNPSANPNNLSVDQLAVAVSVLAGGLALWGIAALVVAGLAVAGQAWARWTLLGSAVLAGLGGVVGTLAFPGFLVVTAAAVLCVVQLLHPDVTAWYAARRGARTGERPAAPPPPQQPW